MKHEGESRWFLRDDGGLDRANVGTSRKAATGPGTVSRHSVGPV